MADFKVLVPLDGSRTAEHSLVYLSALKRLGECRVELLSVADEAEAYHGEATAEAIEREANLLATYLREVSADVKRHVGIEVEQKLVRGAPAQRIAEEIEATKPDLVAISSHGRTGVARWRIGSVADKVIRGSPCATLVIGPNAHRDEVWIDAGAEEPFKQILVPLDGSDLSEAALDTAVHYAEAFGSTIHLVNVIRFPYTDYLYEGASTGDVIDVLQDAANQLVNETAARLAPRVKTTTAVRTGDPATQLEEYVVQHAIDLVVMTTHGRSGFTRTALGSVADRMLAQSAAPVLVVRVG
jgi:nucleotide-binding universal stress UspA family protein